MWVQFYNAFLFQKNGFDAAHSVLYAELMELLTSREPIQGDRERVGTARSGTGNSSGGGYEFGLSA